MNSAGHNDFSPGWIPVFVVGLWLLISFLISRMGWCYFARNYRALSRPEGRSFNCPGAWFGNPFASYRNVLRVVFSSEGVYIYPFFLFRVFHRPFLVPWAKVKGLVSKKIFWISYEVFEIDDGRGKISIRLSRAAKDELQKPKPA